MSQETDCGCLVVQLDVSAQTQKTVVSSDTIWRPATLNGHCVDPPIGGNGSSSDSCRRTNGGWRRLWAKVSRPLLLTLSLTASTGLGLCLLRVAIRPLPRMSLTMGYDLRSDGPPGGSAPVRRRTRAPDCRATPSGGPPRIRRGTGAPAAPVRPGAPSPGTRAGLSKAHTAPAQHRSVARARHRHGGGPRHTLPPRCHHTPHDGRWPVARWVGGGMGLQGLGRGRWCGQRSA